MALSEQSQKIHSAFCTYVKTQDKKIIENFSREDIKFTLIQSNDIGYPHYKAMEMRVAELKEIEERKIERNSTAESLEHKFFKYKEGTYWLQIQEEYEISKKEFEKKSILLRIILKEELYFGI